MKPAEIEHKLLQVNIVQKLRTIRGMNFVKKLVNFVQLKQLPQFQSILNENNQTYIVFTINGLIEVSKRKRGQLQSQQIKPFSYILVDKNIAKIFTLSQCIFFVLSQKYIIQIFEGVISLPFINIRLNELKKNEVFQSMQKRKLVKIAFDLHELHLKIGSRMAVQENDDGEPKMFCYYIISGEVKVVREGIAVCMIGATQILASQIHQKAHGNSTGQIITESAHLYKIPAQLVFQSSKNAAEYVDKRVKWRQARLININRVSMTKNQQKRTSVKQRASFVDKQIVFRSFYGNKIQDLFKLKQLCKPLDIKCQSRQQFYGRKLDKIKQLQKKRYGSMNQTTILFPIEIGRAYQKHSPTDTLTQMKKSRRSRKRVYTEPVSQAVSPTATRANLSFFTTNF